MRKDLDPGDGCHQNKTSPYLWNPGMLDKTEVYETRKAFISARANQTGFETYRLYLGGESYFHGGINGEMVVPDAGMGVAKCRVRT